MNQLTMAGEDWLSDRDRNRTKKAEAAKKKAALDCARKLEAAAESLNAFMSACRECGDQFERGAGDGRLRLVEDCMEYAMYLQSVFAK
ncbi:MAG: hypothetical protein AB3X44_16105 [Leptothrix sp. (in: b-proteobacteria)]